LRKERSVALGAIVGPQQQNEHNIAR